MPVMNGYEAARAGTVPIIAMSANAFVMMSGMLWMPE